MKRALLLGLTALGVLGVGAVLYLALRPAPAKAPPSKVTSTLTNPYVEQGAYYRVSAAYPTTTPLTGAADERAITTMQSWLLATISQFKADTHAENPSPEDMSAMGFDQERRVTFDATYRSTASAHTVSYIFTIYEDTGGAHGNTSFTTFTFDTDPSTPSGQAGAALALADLFTPGAPYLEQLSSLARARLPSILGDAANEQMITSGTAPAAASFASWYLDGENLVLLFPPYAVAPYAAGPQTLALPLAGLASILKPGYRP